MNDYFLSFEAHIRRVTNVSSRDIKKDAKRAPTEERPTATH
jgi:hypothetical protein